MELYERATKLGVPDIHITEEDWQRQYNKSYSILAIDGSDVDKILAAQDIIKIYLVLQEESRQAPVLSTEETEEFCDRCGHSSVEGYCPRCFNRS